MKLFISGWEIRYLRSSITMMRSSSWRAPRNSRPTNAGVYALMARAYANLEDREQALRDVQLAEQYAGQAPASAKDGGAKQSDIYVSTGEALSTLGDQRGAMARFQQGAPHNQRRSRRCAPCHRPAHGGAGPFRGRGAADRAGPDGSRGRRCAAADRGPIHCGRGYL